MSQDNKRSAKRRSSSSARPETATNITISQFAGRIADWLTEWADEDDIRRFVAEFEGVPLENVAVTGDHVTIVSAEQAY